MEWIRKMFYKKSKWMPLHTYTYDWNSYLIIGRVILKTGMPQFKTIRIDGKSLSDSFRCTKYVFEETFPKMIEPPKQ